MGCHTNLLNNTRGGCHVMVGCSKWHGRHFDSQLETQNGALIEAGLDYTIQNFNRTSLKVYARGGAEVWGGDRGTTWRGSGGVTFQF